MIFIKDVLKKKSDQVWVLPSDTSVKATLDMMADKNIGAVPIVADDGSISGIFSERDYSRACAKNNKLCLDCPVADVMTTKVICINPNQTVDNCMALMTDKRIRHIPVLEDGSLVGIISIGDVVKSVISEKDILIDQLEHYIEGTY